MHHRNWDGLTRTKASRMVVSGNRGCRPSIRLMARLIREVRDSAWARLLHRQAMDTRQVFKMTSNDQRLPRALRGSWTCPRPKSGTRAFVIPAILRLNRCLLVYFEAHANPTTAIEREKRLKKWHRKWKLDLIEKSNPDWTDLSDKL